LSSIAALAHVTFREILRRKVQVNLLLFGALMIVASLLVSNLTLGEQHRIVASLGLSAATVFGTLIAAFLGSSLVAGDLERKALLPVLAKPVSRTQYLLGRYGGLSAALLLNLVAMGLALAAVLVLDARSLRPIDRSFLAALATIGIQFLVVGAVAILFSALSTTTLASIFTLAVAIAGHLLDTVRSLWPGEHRWISLVVWHLVPNLGALSLDAAVVYGTGLPARAAWAAVYGLLYAAAVLALASLAFERRDLR
jgi:ABC-type transport system involved in multi-copper enzyme maturation permease subunit